MARGQKTGGRQRGALNKTTIERKIRAEHGVQAATAAGLLPLDVLLARMRDEPLPNGQKPTDEQVQAAVCAAPYVHARFAACALSVSTDVDSLTPAERDARIEFLLAKRRAREAPVIEGKADASGRDELRLPSAHCGSRA